MVALTDGGAGRETVAVAGASSMSRRFACLHWVRTLGAVISIAAVLVSSAVAQDAASDPSNLEAVRLLLDRIEVTLKREGLSAQTIYDLGQTLNPARDDLRARIAELEPQVAQADARLKQLGPPPAKDAPPENAALAEERVRLNKEFGELDAPLKQLRLMAGRADQLADQINELRRAAYARQLFEQSPSVLSPSLWLESAQALGPEAAEFGQVAAVVGRHPAGSRRPSPRRLGRADASGSRHCRDAALAMVAPARRGAGGSDPLRQGGDRDRRDAAHRAYGAARHPGGGQGAGELPASAGAAE